MKKTEKMEPSREALDALFLAREEAFAKLSTIAKQLSPMKEQEFTAMLSSASVALYDHEFLKGKAPVSFTDGSRLYVSLPYTEKTVSLGERAAVETLAQDLSATFFALIEATPSRQELWKKVSKLDGAAEILSKKSGRPVAVCPFGLQKELLEAGHLEPSMVDYLADDARRVASENLARFVKPLLVGATKPTMKAQRAFGM